MRTEEVEKLLALAKEMRTTALFAGKSFHQGGVPTAEQALEALFSTANKMIALLTPNAPKPKRTLHQYTLDGELVATHKSCAAAAEATGNRATRQDISLAARGKAHAAGGYRWQW